MTTSTPSTPGGRNESEAQKRKEKERRAGAIGLTGFNGNSSVVHMAANMCENLGLEIELAYRLAVESRLFRCRG